MWALGLVVVAAFIFACALVVVQRLWERRYRARLAALWGQQEGASPRPRARDAVVPGLIGFFIGSLAVLSAYLALTLQEHTFPLLLLGVILLVVARRLRWPRSAASDDADDAIDEEQPGHHPVPWRQSR